MKNKHLFRLNFWLILLISLTFGCRDVFEGDLSGLNLQVSFPPDSLTTTNNEVIFVFEEMEEAIDYKLTIVNPGFANMQEYVMDSVITQSNFKVNLNVGEYEWELVARNNSSESNRVRRKLFIQEPTTLAEVFLQLTNPQDGYITNEEETLFRWNTVLGDNTYHLQFFEDNNGGLGNPVGNEFTTTADSLLINAPEGKLFWQMFVSNTEEQSPFVQRTLVIDRTPPSNPELLSPLSGSFLTTDTLVFSWNYGVDLLTNTYDSLFVLNEDLFDVLYSLETINTVDSLPLAGFAAGNYIWRIKTYDVAGNFSQSNDGLFTVE